MFLIIRQLIKNICYKLRIKKRKTASNKETVVIIFFRFNLMKQIDLIRCLLSSGLNCFLPDKK